MSSQDSLSGNASDIATRIALAISDVNGEDSDGNMIGYHNASKDILDCLINKDDETLREAMSKCAANSKEDEATFKKILNSTTEDRQFTYQDGTTVQSRLFCIFISQSINTAASPRGMISRNTLDHLESELKSLGIFSAEDTVVLHPKLVTFKDLDKPHSYVFHAHDLLMDHHNGDRPRCNVFAYDSARVGQQVEGTVNFLVGMVRGNNPQLPTEKIDRLCELTDALDDVIQIKFSIGDMSGVVNSDDLELNHEKIQEIRASQLHRH